MLGVAAAALLAHGGCLRSVFYLDDFTQIVETDAVDHGLWYTHHLRVFTYLTYWLTWRLAGMSAPAFHLGNLVLHVAVSLTVLGFARDYLTFAASLPAARAARIAVGAALLLAVHPLGSEVTNYVRARDIALVSEWALLTAWAVLRWRRTGAWWWLAAGAVAAAGGTFSKEVGCLIVGSTGALVWFASRPASAPRPPGWRAYRELIAAGLVLGAIFIGWRLAPASTPGIVFGTARDALSHPRLGWHTLTQARVFWEYAARVFLPIRLCSDHQIAWTISVADRIAWVSLAGMLALCVVVGWILGRARPQSPARAAAALGTVALLDILQRLANVSGELMVEYRMYPVLTMLCLLLAWGWDVAWVRVGTRGDRWRAAGTWAGVGVILLGIGLSERRAWDWRSTDALVANIVAQYPLQARARQEVQEADVRLQHWQAAADREPGIRDALDRQAAENKADPRRRFDPDLATLTRVASEGNYAQALARLGRRREARAHLAWLRGAMEEHRLTDPMFWALFYYASGMLHDAAGEKADALSDLRDSQELVPGMEFAGREYRRISGGRDWNER